MLYTRNYKKITDLEKKAWMKLKKEEIVGKIGKIKVKKSLFRKYPKAVRHYLSLFPNNYLDIVDLKDRKKLTNVIRKFAKKINETCTNERNILNFIKTNQAYFLVGSILKNYFNFGHHEAHIFVEFSIGTSYKSDFLLLGRCSSGWYFVFVEFESPDVKCTQKSGSLGLSFRKGIEQVRKWKFSLESDFGFLKEQFRKYSKDNESLPSELTTFDSTRLFFVVVAGRRKHFNNLTYRLAREEKLNSNIQLLHYDNILDSAKSLIGASTY